MTPVIDKNLCRHLRDAGEVESFRTFSALLNECSRLSQCEEILCCYRATVIMICEWQPGHRQSEGL